MPVQDGLLLPVELLGNAHRFAVYRCYSDSGELLYVGETGELGKRLAQHAQKAWFLQVRGITLEWYADELDALKAERRAIHVEHPKYNIQHRNVTALQPVSPRAQKPRQRRAQPQRRRVAPPGRTRAEAALILKAEPDISGSELGRRLGVQPGYGRRLKRQLAPAGQWGGE